MLGAGKGPDAPLTHVRGLSAVDVARTWDNGLTIVWQRAVIQAQQVTMQKTRARAPRKRLHHDADAAD